ncbi:MULTISPECIES: glycosyltransferase family 4 protein [Flavobacterium]|uniref:Glycosyltransferase family 4 protein n=1 Tax=Flavobacterium jumunjinense TaxID=998845 RepID=A0ABV5GQW9_9FLAO|nr:MULTISPECIES: glycosyltransferase family 1 protein [Flavobacterium]
MKLILDNIIYSHVKQGGVSNYWFELSKHLIKSNHDVTFYEGTNSISNFHRKLLKIPNEKIIKETKNYRSSILERMAKVNINEKEPFLFHSSYYRSLSDTTFGKEVTTVHDFTHNFHSSFLKKQTHNFLKYKSIKKASGIICISDNTYKDLLKFCPPKKNQKVTIIHNGVSDDFFILNKENINQLPLSIEKNGYILFVGGRQNYKNFDFVINILKETSYKLVVVGEALNKEEKLKIGNAIDNVDVLTNIDNITLNILYNNALALIYPSNYEGFGIPVIEAMKAGCPVIALNSSSIPEVSGSAGLLLNELNSIEAKEYLAILSKNTERDIIIEKGIKQSKKFSWEKCCSETEEFYKEIY